MNLFTVGQNQAKPAVERKIIDADERLPLINWRELWHYRDLFYFLVWSDIKTRYAQSVLGIGWAIIQPLISMVVYTIVFGGLANVSSDGVPYAIFSYTALVPWTYFSGAVTSAGHSLTRSSGMVTKVYFPRLIIPFSPVLGKLVDFAIAMVILLAMMVWFRIWPTAGVIFLPFLILLMIVTAAGMGFWLAAMGVQYRDVNYGMSYFIQLLMFAAPVVYPASAVPPQFRLIYSLFPMAGVIEGFRSALLNTGPMPWDMIAVGTVSALIIFASGTIYFRRLERIFADVI